MQFSDFGRIEFLILLVNCSILLGWPLLALFALFSLRRRQLDQTAKSVWVLVVLAVPLMGPIAYWIMRPGDGQMPPAA